MNKAIHLLDCTLRDGAYIVDSKFGTNAISGIMTKLQNANVDIIECGWLKDKSHDIGTTFYHVPSDFEQYMAVPKRTDVLYTAMIDYNRYDLDSLPEYDGKSIDAIRVVFPKEAYKEGISLGEKIKDKGYKLMFQAANTYGYTDAELLDMIEEVNRAEPESLSIVDTFGAMYQNDLARIITLMDHNLDNDIMLGFHSHNNRQLSFALSMYFIDTLCYGKRGIVIDASLCGMGRGAGNTTTELISEFLNEKHNGSYDTDEIMDAIDMYMGYFMENYDWGYSIPYMLAGTYCVHVNNIAYLTKTHRSCAKDMKKILELVEPEKRVKYDYDNLENIYVNYQSRKIDDIGSMDELRKLYEGKEILLIAPGKSSEDEKEAIDKYISAKSPVVIAVNALLCEFPVDAIFFGNQMRYEYAQSTYPKQFYESTKIVLSNIKQEAGDREIIVNYDRLLKTKWKHFDNSAVMLLRLLDSLSPKSIAVAGVDGFNEDVNIYYQDNSLQTQLSYEEKQEVNKDMQEMIDDFFASRMTACRVFPITSTMFRWGKAGE